MQTSNVTRAAVIVFALTPVNSQTFAQKSEKESGVMNAVDTDNDGTISLEEADKAASRRFAKCDGDHDGTLTIQEFQVSFLPKPSKQEFEAMDIDHDGTVSKDEYLAELARVFMKIDTDKDGTIDAKEFRTPMGRILQSLMT